MAASVFTQYTATVNNPACSPRVDDSELSPASGFGPRARSWIATMEPAVGPELSWGEEVFISVEDTMTVTGLPGPQFPAWVGPAVSFVRAPQLEVVT